ncbi:MAG TPA: hypothetical protein VGW34_00750 [Allosphingosinicella sp.]|nr:hypothetical protein [Allosphingosinicella sp.]
MAWFGIRLGLAAAALLAATPAAEAAWLKAESDNFIVYAEGKEARLRQHVTLLEDYDELLRALTGVASQASPRKLEVYLVRGIGQLRTVRPLGSDVLGFYSATPDGIAAFADMGGYNVVFGGDDVLLHEYAHHFMLQYFPAAYPPWYAEGFAEYMMTAEFKPNQIEFGRYNRSRASWLAYRDGWLSMDELLFSDPAELDAPYFYAQSWLTVHYLLRDPARSAALTKFLVATSRGEEPRKAFRRAFQMSPAELGQALQRYAVRGLTYTRVTRESAASPPRITVTQLPASADDLLLLEAALERGVGKKLHKSVLNRVRRAAARYADDPLARRVRARAEALLGDGAVADRLLEPLLAASPGDAELLYIKGMRYLVAGRADEATRRQHFRHARIWFARAHKADADHFPTLFRYAESFSSEPSFVSENTTNILLLAHSLAPQVGEISLQAGQMLLRRGKYGEAEALLAPLAASPHAGKFKKAAAALLAKARAREQNAEMLPFGISTDEDEDRASVGGIAGLQRGPALLSPIGALRRMHAPWTGTSAIWH